MKEKNHVEIIDWDTSCKIVTDSRIAAVRWDLVPWGLVLDLDSSISEGNSAQMRRVWIVFKDVSDVNIPVNNTRLPNGCWITSAMTHEEVSDDFEKYYMSILAPQFEGEKLLSKPTRSLSIKAKSCLCLASVCHAHPTDRLLTFSSRTSLATDDDFLRMI